MSIIANALQMIRQSAHMSIEVAAATAGCDETYLLAVESGTIIPADRKVEDMITRLVACIR